MNQLDPELQRLIRWSRSAEQGLPEGAPYGMAGRVASRWRQSVTESEPAWWPRLQLVATWMSAAVLITGATIWASRLNASTSGAAYDIAPAYQLIARNIAP